MNDIVFSSKYICFFIFLNKEINIKMSESWLGNKQLLFP